MRYYIKDLGMKTLKYLAFPLIALSLTSCASRTSHYNSLMMISSQTSENCRLSFEEFKGNYVFKMQKKSEGESTLKYTASLREGRVDIMYAVNNEDDHLLLTVNSGEKEEGTIRSLSKGNKVYINIISDGTVSGGDFHFETI